MSVFAAVHKWQESRLKKDQGRCLQRNQNTYLKSYMTHKSESLLNQPHMDQYFYQMEKILKEGKTSSRIRFLLQDIIDLKKVS